jgi:hypothetical protein
VRDDDDSLVARQAHALRLHATTALQDNA